MKLMALVLRDAIEIVPVAWALAPTRLAVIWSVPVQPVAVYNVESLSIHRFRYFGDDSGQPARNTTAVKANFLGGGNPVAVCINDNNTKLGIPARRQGGLRLNEYLVFDEIAIAIEVAKPQASFANVEAEGSGDSHVVHSRRRSDKGRTSLGSGCDLEGRHAAAVGQGRAADRQQRYRVVSAVTTTFCARF